LSILTSDSNWHNELIKALAACQVDREFFSEGPFQLLKLTDQLIVHLVSLNHPFSPQNFIQLQEKYAIANIKLIHLWEDIWRSKPAQVLARLSSLLGQNKRIHGRKTKIHKIAKPVADTFLNDNHLQGAVSSRYKIGLFEKDELVAVATFSALRKMNHTENYKSAELIRFAVKAGYSITGGLSKLISYFAHLHQPNDVMTYADRDWSAGEAYLRLGFLQTTAIAPKYYHLNEQLQRQLIKDAQTVDAQIFNTGSLKFILQF
jgi:hypothetical protein